VSVFILRFSFHNSPLSLCFTSIAELCGSLEFRPALSHTVGAGLPPPFGPRRFFRRDRNTNTGIVKFRVVITPAVVILLRDFSRFQLCGLLLPGTKALIQIGSMHTAIKDLRPETDQAIHMPFSEQYFL